MNAITISAVDPGRDLDAFLRVPFQIYRTLPHWVPPLWLERRAALPPGATPYTRRARMQWWIATQGGKVRGRISAHVDPAALMREPGIGHLGLLAATDRPDVVAALTATAEDWLRDQGMSRARGPLDLSLNQESGLLVDGFDTPPMLMMPHNPPTLGPALEAAGYGKVMDLLAYRADPRRPIPDAVRRLMNRSLPPGLRVRPARLGAAYDSEVHTMVDIFNDAWSANWGFVPFDAEEVALLGRELRPLIEKRLVWFAETEGQSVAFLVCLPNLNEAIADLDGRLWPVGWAKLLWRLKARGLRTARVPLMGVRKAMSATLAGSLLPFHLIAALWPELLARKVEAVELSWVLETNKPMRALAELLCGPPCKTYRLYEKALT